jgi:hypothetical protein
MALTFANVVNHESIGNRRTAVTDITLDNNYTTGGYVLTPQQIGMDNAVIYGDAGVKTVVALGPNGAFLDCSNPAAPKLKLNAAAAEVGAAAVLTGSIVEVTAVGY